MAVQSEAGAGAPGDQGAGAPETNVDMVPKADLLAMQAKLDHKGSLLDSSNGTLSELNEAFGGKLTVDEIKGLKEARELKAAADQDAAIKDGRSEELLEAARLEGRDAVDAQKRQTAVWKDALRVEKLGALASTQLVASGVHPQALQAAKNSLLDPNQAGPDGVYMELLHNESENTFSPVLRQRGAGNLWPSDNKGEKLSIEAHVQGFKGRNSFYFVPTIEPGAGGGPGGSAGPASQDAASTRKAIDGGDHTTYADNRANIWGDPSLKN
ncbi:MAG: hypothetical protein ACI88C_000057 [Acidimicrobiales bacterium]|jgi:hypothetical protein